MRLFDKLRGFVSPLRYPFLQEGSVAVNMCEYAVFLWRRNKWMLDPRWMVSNFEHISIDRPIFLLGVHSGGLTVISRMLRRQQSVVSVTGGSDYWSGADEMESVYGPILPKELTGTKHKMPPAPRLQSPANWLYANDEFLPYYRNTEKDVTSEARHRFRTILRWTIARHAQDPKNARFIDKSQLFTVKVSFLNALLRDTDPRFVLVTRNPYAVCLRTASELYHNYRYLEPCTFERALEMVSQHWANSMRCALEDGARDHVSLIWVRMEDMLAQPEEQLRIICEFVELDFSQDMLPQPHHTVPFGSKGHEKWYPLRKNVNDKYLSKLTPEYAHIIERTAGNMIEYFNYKPPS